MSKSVTVKREDGYPRAMPPLTPTLRISLDLLEERLRPLIESELLRPVLERILSEGGREVSVDAPGVESRLARVSRSLAGVLSGSALHVSAQRPLAEFAAVFSGSDDSTAIALPLIPPSEELLEEIEIWLQIAPDERTAVAVQRQIGLARGLDWSQVESLLVEAFERHLLAPDERAGALSAFQALMRAHALFEVSLVSRIHAAWSALRRDLRKPFIALDAGKTHHTILTRWRDLPKTGEMRVPAREGFAEIITPNAGGTVALRLDVHEIPMRLIEAIRHWRSWHGLRHWAALQRLFTLAGRTGRIRWNLNDHMEALGLSERARRMPHIRTKVADEVEALTRLEVAVYNNDGTLRLRGPILAVTQRGEALRGSEWALEGLELMIHPVLYEGVRKGSGDLGTLWTPAPAELAHVDERLHPHALALGLILPIRWRWDLGSNQDHLVLTGQKLLETAGIQRSPRNPGRCWQTLDLNLQVLQNIGGVGHIEWESDEKHTLEGRCHLHPPAWIRDRLVHHLLPEENVRDIALLTGNDLAEWRRSLRLTQATLASQLGLSQSTIWRAEASQDRALTSSLREALGRFQKPELPPTASSAALVEPTGQKPAQGVDDDSRNTSS